VIQRHEWNLLFHDCLAGQLQKLEAAVVRAKVLLFNRTFDFSAQTSLSFLS
jgi:hypothetical protein